MYRFISLILITLALIGTPASYVFADNANPDLAIIDNLSSAFERVSKRIAPSVVAISAVKKAKKVKSETGRSNSRRGRSPLDELFGRGNSPFDELFGNRRAPSRETPENGLGSGVIVSKDGYILTNNHVIEGADELTVTMQDDTIYEAKLIGGDPRSDIAVIKIEATDLRAARLGDSAKLKVGQWVVAAGSPFNLQQSITAGIISATGRSDVGIADYEDFIQTDAAINPGNSGGPLVALTGEVVGINTAIFSKSGGYMGVGFAIPVSMAKNIMDSLIKNGKVERGFLGVVIQKFDKDLAGSFGFSETDGALVSEVNEDSPAKRAGVMVEDIITKFDGVRIKNPSHLKNRVGQTDPSLKVNMEVFRNGKYKTLTVKVGKLESDKEEAEPESEEVVNELGVDVSEITPEIKYKLGLKNDEGVVVTFVEPASIAQNNGLRRGDVITKLNGKEVSTSKDFYSKISKANFKKGVRIAIKRKGGRLFLFIKE